MFVFTDFFDDLFAKAQVGNVYAVRAMTIASEELYSLRQQQGAHSVSSMETRRSELCDLMNKEVIRIFLFASSILTKPAAAADESRPFCTELLLCVKQCLKWAPEETVFSTQTPVISALLGLLDVAPLATSAMDCLCELLARTRIPTTPVAQELLQSVYERAFGLVGTLASVRSRADLEPLNDEDGNDTLGKVTQLALLLLKNVRRVPGWGKAGAFFAAFVRLTELQPSVLNQLNSLEGLGTFLEDLLGSVFDGDPTACALFTGQLQGPVLGAQEQVLRLALHASNGEVLNSLSYETMTDDESESELGMYVSACLRVVVLCTELLLETALPRAAGLVASSVDTLVAAGPGAVAAAPLGTVEDALTLLLLAAGLAELIVGDALTTHVDTAQKLVQCTIAAVEWANSGSLYARGPAEAAVHARLILTLSAWTRWTVEVLRSGTENAEAAAFAVTERMIRAVLPFLIAPPSPPPPPQKTSVTDPGLYTKVVMAASQTLRNVCLAVHAKAMLTMPELTAALNATAFVQGQLPEQAQGRVYCALLYVLAMPSAGLPLKLQQWDARKAKCAELLATVVAPFVELSSPQLAPQHAALVPAVVQRTEQLVRLLHNICRGFRDAADHPKNVVYAAVAPALPAALTLAGLYRPHPARLLYLLEFVRGLFESFGVHIIGARTTEDAVKLLVPLIGGPIPGGSSNNNIGVNNNGVGVGEALCAVLATPGAPAASVSVVCCVLDLFRTLAKECVSFKSMLGDVLWLALQRIHPVSKQAGYPHVSIQSSLVKLVVTLLTNHFPTLSQEPWVSLAMDVLVTALAGKELAPYGDVVTALERLFAATRICEKPFFKAQFWLSFASALLNSVVFKAHELRSDDSISALHALATVDWNVFYQKFLPGYVASLPDITPDQAAKLLADFRPVEDLPSFSTSLRQLTNDYNYILRGNSAK